MHGLTYAELAVEHDRAKAEIERLRVELAEEKMLKQGWIDEFIKLRDMGEPNLED